MNHSIADSILDAIIPWVVLIGLAFLIVLVIGLVFMLLASIFGDDAKPKARVFRCPKCNTAVFEDNEET